MSRRTLAQWLDYQLSTHPRDIALGLERVRVVWERLGAPRPAPLVVTVGGTNGKGSTVAFVEATLRAAGVRVGAYTSPHLFAYNERVRIDGHDVEDAVLVGAFERIEAARGEVPLTYFEFGTLAAFVAMHDARCEAAVLEVGLGGRLDAVNLVDADVAVVTTVDLDHQDYLGRDREAIGFEKAGIFRAGRPAIVGDLLPPRSLVAQAVGVGAQVERIGAEFTMTRGRESLRWKHRDGTALSLPRPSLAAPVQAQNVAVAVAALHAVRDRWPASTEAYVTGVATARVRGRLERIASEPEVIVDVGHNPQAARELARWLRESPVVGRTYAVFSALADKDIPEIVAPLAGLVRGWFLAGLDAESPRGLPAAEVRHRCEPVIASAIAGSAASVPEALAQARSHARPNDRIVVYGSFFTVAAAMRAVSSL